MFTGLVAECGRVRSISGRALTIESTFSGLELGESVACDGVCLTVTTMNGGVFTVDVGDETLKRTTIGGWRPGHRVHLERAMRLGDRLGGHIVQGHVDGVGQIAGIVPGAAFMRIDVSAPAELRRFFVEKGSVCVDGVSLTINGLTEQGFHVGIVPHTQQVTHLAQLGVGDRVNLEVDVLARYVERLLGGSGGGLDLAKLRAAGFA
jgi:riboflavin synthase